MPKIKNKLNQPVLISLTEEKSIGLLASGSAAIDDADMASSHLKGFIERGEIVVFAAEQVVEKTAEPQLEKEIEKPAEIEPKNVSELLAATGTRSKGKTKSDSKGGSKNG